MRSDHMLPPGSPQITTAEDMLLIVEAPLPFSCARLPPVPSPAPRMVGREAELASLQARWSTALDGARQVVFLSGEAGIGKSRL